MKKYIRPCINSYSTNEMRELIGPIQTASVEFQIYTEQIQASLSNKTDVVLMVAKIEKPDVYKLDKIV